jgi:hypothetical protein
MGLGKTVAILTALEELFNDRHAVNKCLVIAPLRVARDTWAAECRKWDHIQNLRLSIVLGNADERCAALFVAADIYVINRENVSWLVGYYGDNWPFDCIVIDELSSFKNHRSKRFEALRMVLPRVKRLYGLTGTPAPNGLCDLWAPMYLLDRGYRLFNKITPFHKKWFYPIRVDPNNPAIVWDWLPKEGASEEIYGRIADITVSCESGLVKLPERIDVDHFVEIPREEYESMLKDYCVDDILAVNAAVAIGKLQQIANGCIYDGTGDYQIIHDAKLDALEDLWEAANGRNILVYYQYQFDAKRILERWECAREIKSESSVADWMQGKIQFGVAHAASCGHGLNLQSGGNIVIWFGIPWSLELYQQANARIHRQGQTETVFVHHILAENTVDSDVMDRLHGKDTSQRELLFKLLRRV